MPTSSELAAQTIKIKNANRIICDELTTHQQCVISRKISDDEKHSNGQLTSNELAAQTLRSKNIKKLIDIKSYQLTEVSIFNHQTKDVAIQLLYETAHHERIYAKLKVSMNNSIVYGIESNKRTITILRTVNDEQLLQDILCKYKLKINITS